MSPHHPTSIKKLLEEPFWLSTLDASDSYSRQHDDTDGGPDGVLAVFFGPDGDAYLSIDLHAALRFRTYGGGGHSLRVRNALMILAEAIRLDNEDRPQRPRTP